MAKAFAWMSFCLRVSAALISFLALGSEMACAAAPQAPEQKTQVDKAASVPNATALRAEPSPSLPPSHRMRSFSVSMLTGVPEILGVSLSWRISAWAAASLHYALPTRLRVNVDLPSKVLLNKSGFIIKSPDLVLPVDIDIGPQWGGVVEGFPFGGSFFLFGGLESRITTVKSQAESQLIFVDSAGEKTSNSQIEAKVDSRTDQVLLRIGLGNRWSLIDGLVTFGYFLGATKPFAASSNIRTQIRVRNPAASNPDEVEASNLAEAQAEQERILQEKAYKSIARYEAMALPLLGLNLGISF